ncbi:hypothetical protein BJX65DRAFT_263818 [Aspergillus insuetus]
MYDRGARQIVPSLPVIRPLHRSFLKWCSMSLARSQSESPLRCLQGRCEGPRSPIAPSTAVQPPLAPSSTVMSACIVPSC